MAKLEVVAKLRNRVQPEDKEVLILDGAGGGGNAVNHLRDNNSVSWPGNGILSIGGFASKSDLISSSWYATSGGGAGCTPGSGACSSTGAEANDGNTGTGGLLCVYAKKVKLTENSYFSSMGANRRRCKNNNNKKLVCSWRSWFGRRFYQYIYRRYRSTSGNNKFSYKCFWGSWWRWK